MRIRRLTTAPLALLILALLALVAAACGGSASEPPAPPDVQSPAPTDPAPAPPPPPPPADPAPTEPVPPAPLDVTFQIADRTERQVLAATLDQSGSYDVTEDPNALIQVSDTPIDGAQPYVVASWAAIVHQRHDVLDLSLDALRDVLSGRITNWEDVGGSPQPIIVVQPDATGPLPQELGIDRFASSDQQITADSVLDVIAALPGAVTVVSIHDLQPGVVPLVVDGHDPLRDPADASPLIRTRWIGATDPQAALDVATALAWTDDPLDPIGLLATGDYIPTRCVGSAIDIAASGDFNAIFDRVGDTLRAADVALVSMEVAATDLRTPPTTCAPRQFILSAGSEAVDALAATGVDIVTTAGNHAGDCFGGCLWREAILDTIAQLERVGLAHAGTGPTLAAARAPAIIEQSATRLAVLSYDAIAFYYFAPDDGPGTAPALPDVIAADVLAARRLADHVIVAVSWGTEYTATISAAQRAIADAALGAGASLIVGNHPHWVQPIATIASAPVDNAIAAFALGNFVFDQSWSIRTTQSVLLEVGFTADRILGYRVRPVVVRHDFQPELVDPAGDEGQQILSQLWTATDRFTNAP